MGSIERVTQGMYVVSGGNIVSKDVTIVPGLYKIFDEVLVNAVDHWRRGCSVTKIKVTIDVSAGTIAVWNDGDGVPAVIHNEHKLYVPEMIFGHLLTSSNYDDTEKKGMMHACMHVYIYMYDACMIHACMYV